jgi:DNA repair protein RadC
MGRASNTNILRVSGLNLSELSDVDGSPCFQVSGDTHPHRHMFREIGGSWDKMKRVWVFSGTSPETAIVQHLRENPHIANGLSDQNQDKPHYWGHRERLRNRFMGPGDNGLPDYELLELILFQCIERIDVKPLAKDLLASFGSLGAVLAAEPERLAEHDKLTYAGIVHFKALQDLHSRIAAEEIGKGPVLGSWDKLIRYLKSALAHAKTERFQVLFLNARNELIADEIQQRGTVNHTPVYPREVIKRALELGATAIIMVHNHPSGDPAPSPADIKMTKDIADAALKLEITVHDHIIMSKHGHTSFRDMGLL